MWHAQVPSRIYKYSCYQYNSLCVYMRLPRSLKNPYQTILAKTVITE